MASRRELRRERRKLRLDGSGGCQLGPTPLRVFPQSMVGCNDHIECVGQRRKILASHDEIKFVFANSGVHAITDASETKNGAGLQTGGQRHTCRPAESRCAAGYSSALRLHSGASRLPAGKRTAQHPE